MNPFIEIKVLPENFFGHHHDDEELVVLPAKTIHDILSAFGYNSLTGIKKLMHSRIESVKSMEELKEYLLSEVVFIELSKWQTEYELDQAPGNQLP